MVNVPDPVCRVKLLAAAAVVAPLITGVVRVLLVKVSVVSLATTI